MATALIVCSLPCASLAREQSLRVGVSSGFEWYDRSYDQESTESDAEVTTTEDLARLDDSYSRFRISPLLEVTSISARDEARFSYSPSYRYNVDTYEHDLDHNLEGSYSRQLSRNLGLRLTENYRYSDSATEESDTISDSNGRRVYWTNNFGARTEYSYWEDSDVFISYQLDNLRNVDVLSGSGYEDYDRHTVAAGADHRFDSIWNLALNGSYVRGFFDQIDPVDELSQVVDDDLREYHLTTTLEAGMIEHHPLSLEYRFYGVDYDDQDRNSSTIHDMTFSWTWQYDQDATIRLGAGPTYYETDGGGHDWGYNSDLAITYRLAQGEIKWAGKRGYERQNFTGSDEKGLREFWESRLDFGYDLLENLRGSLFAGYRYENREELASVTAGENGTLESLYQVVNRKRISAGATLGYSFWEWYGVTLSYNYLNQDSEAQGDSYDEHRVSLMLSYSGQWYKW